MATDGPDPPACDPVIFKNGECVFVTHTIGPNSIEEWVKAVAAVSGQPVDWHYCGGRAAVLAMGDIEKVKESIEYMKPIHDKLFKEAEERIWSDASRVISHPVPKLQ